MSSRLSTMRVAENWRMSTRPVYWFSTAPVSVTEVENDIAKEPIEAVVSKEEQQKEEHHRVRMSDVSRWGANACE